MPVGEEYRTYATLFFEAQATREAAGIQGQDAIYEMAFHPGVLAFKIVGP